MNKSGLRPLGRAVLVKPYVPERVASIIELPDFVEAQNSSLEQRAIVVEVGISAWCDEPMPRAKPGDRVLVSKFAGHMAKGTADGEQYRFVNDRDIFAAIETEVEAHGN